MPWPTPQEYNEAIQAPALCFDDRELRAGSPDLTALGLPRPITGNFASVYRMRCGTRDWAVRCFWREFADLRSRYAAISAHLAAARLPYTVGFQYLERGIRVRGQWYPILKMEWVEGVLLDRAVEERLQDVAALRRLAADWHRMCEALAGAGIAHGDLQHGNVLLAGERLVLVDYDGMYVPALAGRGSHEVGHPNYQHPRRTGADFGTYLDRFAARTIHLSLQALAGDPTLWQALGGGDECLLLRKADYLDTAGSRAFAALAGHEDGAVVAAATELRRVLTRSLATVPALEAGGAVEQRSPARGMQRAAWLLALLAPAVPADVAAATGAGTPAGPAWLVEHLPAEADPVDPPMPSPALRALLPTWAALLALSAFADGRAVMPATAVIALDSATLVAGIAVFLFAYRRAAPVRALARLLRRERALSRDMARLNRAVRELTEERERAHDAHALVLADLTCAREALADEERAARDRLTADRDSRLTQLEEEERRSGRRREAARAAALDEVQAAHVHLALRRARLPRADLPGVGRLTRLKLLALGVWAAADMTAEKVRAIGGVSHLSHGELLALVTWRVEVEREARRTAPNRIEPAVLTQIEARHAAMAERLSATRRSIEEAYEREVEHLRENVRMRTMALQEQLASRQDEFASDMATLDAEIAAVREQAPRRAAEWTATRNALRPYREVSLRRYLTALYSPR